MGTGRSIIRCGELRVVFRTTFSPRATGTPDSSKYVNPLTTPVVLPQINRIEDPRDTFQPLGGHGDPVVPAPQENDQRDA